MRRWPSIRLTNQFSSPHLILFSITSGLFFPWKEDATLIIGIYELKEEYSDDKRTYTTLDEDPI